MIQSLESFVTSLKSENEAVYNTGGRLKPPLNTHFHTIYHFYKDTGISL